MEVIHDSGFWRDLSHARPAEKDGGAEYRVEKTNSGFAVSGPALGKRSYFKTENKAMSLARHIIGPKGALSLASRRTAKQPANACQRNSDIRPPADISGMPNSNMTPHFHCRCQTNQHARHSLNSFSGETKKSQNASRTRYSKRDTIGSARNAAPVISSKFRATGPANTGLIF